MPKSPLSKRPAFWWTLFALATAIILAFVPNANALQKALRAELGPQGVRWTLIGAVVLTAAGFSALLARRRSSIGAGRLARMLAVPAVSVLWMAKMSIVAEAFHLVEYGLLGAVAFRALACRFPDATAYVTAALLTALVGAFDELVQWLVPGRFWDLHDVGLNAAGGLLAQLWIALGWNPSWISWRPAPESIRPAARWAIVCFVLGLIVVLVPWLRH